MNTQVDPFVEIAIRLAEIRQQAKTKQKFPQELWDAIISLTQSYSIQEVSKRLNINPSYLKRKIRDFLPIRELDFSEVPVQNICSGMVSVELFSDSGLRAKIQGPPSCLSYLTTLFGR